MPTEIRFAFVDVFADRPLTGNPLTVVPDADGLDVAQMTAIAREFNQSETTFIRTPSVPSATRELRSFTPGGVEVGGAGHNALGAWLWLAHTGELDHIADWRQQIGADVSPVERSIGPGGRTTIAMYQSAPVHHERVADRGVLADALGLEPADLTGPAKTVSTGVAHLMIPVADTRSVDAAHPTPAALADVLRDIGGEGAYVYTTATGEPGTHAYSRFFNPTVGISEDPATGTAAGPLAARLARERLVPADGEVVILQGAKLGRPSTIRIQLAADTVRISAAGIATGEGVLWI